MADTTSKKGAGLIIDAIAIVLAIVGIVTMVVSSNIGTGNEIAGLPLYLCLSIVAVALVVAAIWMDLKNADKGPSLVVMFALGIAIFLLAYSGIQVVSSRALTISGLFSWNSMDTVGWNMFKVAATSTGCLVVSAVLLAVGSFLPIAKGSKK